MSFSSPIDSQYFHLSHNQKLAIDISQKLAEGNTWKEIEKEFNITQGQAFALIESILGDKNE